MNVSDFGVVIGTSLVISDDDENFFFSVMSRTAMLHMFKTTKIKFKFNLNENSSIHL